MKHLLTFFFVIVALASTSLAVDNGGFEKRPLGKRQVAGISESICPKLKESSFWEGLYVLGNSSAVQIASSQALSDVECKKIRGLFKSYWNLEPQFTFSTDANLSSMAPEGYGINVSPSLLKISAKEMSGIIHALKTVRQLAEPQKGTLNKIIACCDINDYPMLNFRGVHLCLFPEKSIAEIEKLIRLAAYYKFNYVVLECWGTFPFKTHPELSFFDKQYSRRDMKRLIDLCYELNITPIPHMSILGHVCGSLNASSKHAILTRHPELEEMFERQSWTWCMTSEKAEKVLKEAIAEMHEFFGNPPFFHVGCDESHDMGTCYTCRAKDIKQLFTSHIVKYRDFLKERNARIIMWHDMLLSEKDPRWAGCSAWGYRDMQPESLVEGGLPKDIVIADWEYSETDFNKTEWQSAKFFKANGFDTLVCPWNNVLGIRTLAETAIKEKMLGLLSTTWTHTTGNTGRKTFYTSSNAAWGNPESAYLPDWPFSNVSYGKHILTIENDMSLTKYEDIGTNRNQVHDCLRR